MNNPIKERKIIHKKTKKEEKTIQACKHDIQRWGFVHSNFFWARDIIDSSPSFTNH